MKFTEGLNRDFVVQMAFFCKGLTTVSLGTAVSGKTRQNKCLDRGFSNSPSLLLNMSFTVLHAGLSSKDGWGTTSPGTPCNLAVGSFSWEMWVWISSGRCLPLPCCWVKRGHYPSILRNYSLEEKPYVPKLEKNVLGWVEQRWPWKPSFSVWGSQPLLKGELHPHSSPLCPHCRAGSPFSSALSSVTAMLHDSMLWTCMWLWAPSSEKCALLAIPQPRLVVNLSLSSF